MKKSEPNTFLCCFSHFCYIIQVPVCKIWSALFPSQSSLSINNSNLIATLVLVHWKMNAYIRKCVISTKDMVIKVQLSKVDILSVCACEFRLRLANFNFRRGEPARQDVLRRGIARLGFQRRTDPIGRMELSALTCNQQVRRITTNNILGTNYGLLFVVTHNQINLTLY